MSFSDDMFSVWYVDWEWGCIFFFGMSLSMHFFLHKGFSALHWAVDGGHIDVVQYILSEGVPVSHMGTCIASKCLTLG